MRTSWAQGQPTEAMRDGYKVIRRAGRYQVFPRAALAEVAGRTGPRDVLIEIWNGMPFLSPLWNPGLGHPVAPRARRDVEHDPRTQARAHRGRLRVQGGPAAVPPLGHRHAVRVVQDRAGRRAGLPQNGSRSSTPGSTPLHAGWPQSPHPLVMAVGRMAPVKRYDLLVRAAHHARTVPTCASTSWATATTGRVQAVVDELGAHDWVTLRGSLTEADKLDLFREAWIIASASAARAGA